nr:phospholipase-like protein [Tanacetum cinerariifolium]
MYVPTYTLSGFVFAFQIFESFERYNCWWIKDPNVIPRAVGWLKKSMFYRSDCGCLFAKIGINHNCDIRPTKAEYESSWWIRSQAQKWIKDEVISQLNLCVFKLETIIQVLARERKNEYRKLLQFKDEFSRLGHYLVEEELRLCLEAEERMRLEHEKIIIEEQGFRVNEAKRMKLEEGKLLEISDLKKKILLQNSTTLFYANSDKYATPWNDVDQVFFPINETAQHWCLAHFDILSGLVSFYDSGDTYDYESRDLYVRVQECLQERLPGILGATKEFRKKGIDPTDYSIRFKLADPVPKQGDPIDVALAYREKIVRFYVSHKIDTF